MCFSRFPEPVLVKFTIKGINPDNYFIIELSQNRLMERSEYYKAQN